VQRVAAIILFLCYAALGSGAVERWHNAQHAAEDAQLLVHGHLTQTPIDRAPIHNDSNCAFHAQLHIAGMALTWTPLLICLGVFLAFLTLLPNRLTPQRRELPIPCRGPPRR